MNISINQGCRGPSEGVKIGVELGGGLVPREYRSSTLPTPSYLVPQPILRSIKWEVNARKI